MENESKEFRSGYVALIGRPNVGKSTLMNRILADKVSIVTFKPQTTRNRILGILSTQEYQMLFLDTPGMHRRKEEGIDGFMLQEARTALSDADVVVFLTEADVSTGRDSKVLESIKESGITSVAVINKIDELRDKKKLLPQMAALQKKGFSEIVPVSALKGDGVDVLVEVLTGLLPEGPAYYPDDQLTDQNMRFIASEIIREKVFLAMQDEIPYSTAVEIEEYKDREDGSAYISAVILVERDSQKGILIGKGGAVLKKIGEAARTEIEILQDAKVFVKLVVRVSKNWTKNQAKLRELGYTKQ